jgi:hypothetical protein
MRKFETIEATLGVYIKIFFDEKFTTGSCTLFVIAFVSRTTRGTQETKTAGFPSTLSLLYLYIAIDAIGTV